MAKARGVEEAEVVDGGSGDGLIGFLEELEWTDTRWRLNRARDGEPGQPGRWLESGTGEITEDGIFQRYGGGDYVLNVKRPNEGWKRYAIPIEGAPVEKSTRGAASAAPVIGPANDPIVDLRKQLEALRLEQQISGMRAELARAANPAPPAPARPVDPLELLERMLRIQRELAPPAPARGDTLAPERMLEMFEKGMEAASRAEGHGDVVGVIREGLELAREMFTRRGAPPAPAPDTRTAPRIVPRSPELDAAHELARFLERGLSKGTPADELADAADTIFTDHELGMMRIARADDVMSRLAPVIEAHPPLAQPGARAYVEAWLEQLRVVPTEEAPPTANAS